MTKKGVCVALPLLFALAAPPAWCAENFGDEVVRCLVSKGVHADAPDFNAASKVCEQEVDLARRRDQQAELRNVWNRCLAKEIAAIDDGVSSASDIATAVQSYCEKEYSATVDAAFPSSPKMRSMAEQDRFKTTKEAATTIVLLVRAAKNKAIRTQTVRPQ